MNVVILTSGDFPYGGSSEAIVRNIALGCHENDINIEVVRLRGVRYNYDNDINIKSSNYLLKKPITNDLIKILELLLIIFFIPIFIFIRKFIKKDDSIILYGIEYCYQIVPFIVFSKLFKIKCIRIITDSYRISSIAPVWWKRPKYWAYIIQQKYFDKHLDGIFVLSKFLYNRSLKYGVKENNIMLIPHFIEITDNKCDSPNNTDNIIGFCGTVNIENGVIDLIKAFKLVNSTIPNAKLLIIGKISEDMKRKINKLEVEMNNITFTGQLDKQQVEETLKKCSILVNPRRKSEWATAGFPTKLGEYFASGKPVVATKVGDLVHYFQDKNQIVFAEPGSVESIAEAIVFLIENTNNAKIIAKNGFEWARVNLDYKSNTLKMINFISNTMKED